MGLFGNTGKKAEQIYYDVSKKSKYDGQTIAEIHEAILTHQNNLIASKISDVIVALTRLQEQSTDKTIYNINLLSGTFATKDKILVFRKNPLRERGYYILNYEEYQEEFGLIQFVKSCIEQEELQLQYLKHIERV